MMHQLFDYFKKTMAISPEMEHKLTKIVMQKNLVKGAQILPENSLKKEHIFVTSGCLRSFYTSEDTKEHTLQFAIKNWWISDYITLYTDKKSLLCIESLTNTTVLTIQNKDLESFYNEFPQLEAFQRKNFERRIAALQKRTLNLLALTASEKYNQFVKEYSEFEKIIPNYQIASYLGITPQSLSRIRKERVKNNLLP